MARARLPACLALGLVVTAGCSPVETARLNGGPTNDQGYETLASEAAVTSTLGGTALKLRESPDQVTISSSSGALQHDTGAIRIDDGTYVIADANGFDPNGLLTDGFSVLVATPAQGFTNNYDYAFVYNQAYVAGGTPYSVTGVTGIVTQTGDMPTSGSASFAGEASGLYTSGEDSFDLKNGASAVTANFGSGTVSVRMSGFESVNRDSGDSADVGFDAVNIDGMSISGNSFSGGTVITQSGTSTTEVVGTRAEQQSAGRFYGLTSSGAPDEVGGIGYLRGSDGSVRAVFLAD